MHHSKDSLLQQRTRKARGGTVLQEDVEHAEGVDNDVFAGGVCAQARQRSVQRVGQQLLRFWRIPHIFHSRAQQL